MNIILLKERVAISPEFTAEERDLVLDAINALDEHPSEPFAAYRKTVRRVAAARERAFAAARSNIKTLAGLVQCLIDNDPEDLAADGGIRVIDVWRKEAERALAAVKIAEAS